MDQPEEDREDVVFVGMDLTKEAMNRVYKPTGKHSSPGKTCKHIKMAATEPLKNGNYWVDPNEGSADDAIMVFCNMETEETCVYSRKEEHASQRWTQDEREQYFMEELNNGGEFSYNVDTVQLGFLQLISTSATQTVTYNCLNSSPHGLRFTSHSGEEIETSFLRYKRTTYIDIQDECTNDNQWHSAVYKVRTAKTELLPVTDMLLFDIGRFNQQFGVKVGMACFK